MAYFPLNYDGINAVAGSFSPSAVKSYNNLTFAYWERSLFQRASSVFEFECPINWTGKVKDFFKYCLYRFGFVVISQNMEYGFYFQPCTISGQDFYYQPTRCIVSNPALNVELSLGSDGELLKLTPDYMGVWDIITYYAEKLSLLDNAINMSLINNKFAFILGGKTKGAVAALKKIMDKVNEGSPAVFYDSRIANDVDKTTPFQSWERSNLKQSYLTSDQLKDFNTIINNFDNEIGIPTIPYEKKERMVSDEATSRMIDSVSRISIWMDTLRGSIEEVKALYPDIKLNVRYRKDIGKIINGENGGNEDVEG